MQELRQELSRQAAAAELARDEAISEESQPENKWDTHSQEAAYLAEGQAKLAAEVGESIKLYETLALPDFQPTDTIALGAVVSLGATASDSQSTAATWYFLGPRGGGLELKIDDRTILVVTPQSPLGRQLVGKQVGDMVQPPGRGTPPLQRIASVE